MEPRDRMIACVNCGKEFVFSARDQVYYKNMGFGSPPKRCRECRALLKRERQFATDAAGNTREFFKCECASCGRPAYVPFKPTGSKPVYCRDCFVARKIRLEAQGDTGDAPTPPDGGPPA